MKTIRQICLALTVMLSAAAAHASEVDACYGETLEIQIHMFAPDQPNGGEVIMSLPNPASWTLIGRDGRGSLHDAGCQEEPVPVNQAYSSGMLNKFSAALDKIDAPSALRDVVSLSINGRGKERPASNFYSEYFNEEDWLAIPYGFRRLNSKGDELVMSWHGRSFTVGTILFPDHYQAPFDQPMVAACRRFGFCQVNYILHDRMRLKYKFRSTLEYDENWIPQDQALRALINSWVVPPDATD